ncbi:MAG: 30S ribosomal protein S15 [Planctomycetota bacterium]|nr:30S ribosomal protein S15 [Planctomycetota bacterium]
MTISATAKTNVIAANGLHATDTGSPEVQIAVLTERITALTEHFKLHKHDHAGRRGLLILVGKRNRLLKYLAESRREDYITLIHKLGLRK